MVNLIITHPSSAHKDDLLAVSVLIALHGAPVVRREPTAEELNDVSVAVVDIGGCHDAAKMNFDHHQFPREHEPTCSLSLVLKHLGLYEDASQFCDWLVPAEWFDSRGPNKTAEYLGVPRRAISQLSSPIDATLMRRIARSADINTGEILYEFMRLVGEDLLEYLRAAREQIDFVAAHSEHWSIGKGEEMIEVVFLPRTEPLAADPNNSVTSYVRAEGLGESVAAVVYPDRRRMGYGISRYEDHPKLDFSRIANEPDVHFAHKSGFMCKTQATESERLKALIIAAWGESEPEG